MNVNDKLLPCPHCGKTETLEFATRRELEDCPNFDDCDAEKCEYVIKDNMNETEGMGDVWIECSACHCAFDYYADEWLMNMHYCPNCGAKVVES